MISCQFVHRTPLRVFGEVGLPVLLPVGVVPESDGHRGEGRRAHQLTGLRAGLHGVAVLVPTLQRMERDPFRFN